MIIVLQDGENRKWQLGGKDCRNFEIFRHFLEFRNVEQKFVQVVVDVESTLNILVLL